jgi:drug/metabolite transporter (DMT)-like permease
MIHLLALLGVLVISFSAIFVRLADVSPATATLFRMAYALPPLTALWLWARRRAATSAFRAWLAFLSGVVLAVDLSMWHWSIALIGAGLATVLANVQVVFVGAFAWMLFKEKPTARAITILPLIFLGVVLISGLGRSDAYGSNPVLGAYLGTAAGASYAAFLLLFRSSNKGLVHPSGPLLYATLGAAIGTLAVAMFDPGFRAGINWPAHGWLLALALLPQLLGWLLIATALPRLPALEISVLLLLQPMLTVIWGVIIFAESLSLLQLLGVLMVLGGIALVTLTGGAVRQIRAPSEP